MRSRLSHSTSVPELRNSRGSSRNSDPLDAPSNILQPSSEDAAIASRSHLKQEVLEFLFEATVKHRHCENEAVFKPIPNRPRSVAARSSSGLFAPNVIAVSNSASSMPRPLSRMEIQLDGPRQSNVTCTSEAPAEMLLSITSAKAAAVVYPRPLSASSRAAALGGAYLLLIVI